MAFTDRVPGPMCAHANGHNPALFRQVVGSRDEDPPDVEQMNIPVFMLETRANRVEH